MNAQYTMEQASHIVIVGRAWAGFDPVTEEAGAVQYIKGSHKWGKFFAPATFGSDSHFADIYRKAGLKVSDTLRHWQLRRGNHSTEQGQCLQENTDSPRGPGQA